MMLSAEHIDYIQKDLLYRGIVHDGLQDEFLDHICSAVEAQMATGIRFIDAYHQVLKSFGYTAGLRQAQELTLIAENSKTKLMLKNYFTIAIRNLKKHRFYTSINVAGLSLGVAICFIILLFVFYELSYDRHFDKAERIYRINSKIVFGGFDHDMTYAPAPLAATLVSEFPEVEAAIRFRERGSYLIKRNDDNIKETRVIWTDKDFFKIFSVPVLEGNPEKALSEPNTIAISKHIADKFFVNESALGQTLILDNNISVKVGAVYEPMPANSHFHFDVLISLEGLDEAKRDVWYSNNFQTYLLLKEGAQAVDLEAKIPDLIMKYIMPQLGEVLGGDFTPEKFKSSGNKLEYRLQALTDIHLKSDLQGEFEPNFDIQYIYMFSAVALFILMMACINFMNLSTARSANRAKEVGIRKVMGSYRSHLVRQFLTESVLLSVFSFVVAVGLAYMLLPFFNQLADRPLAIPFHNSMLYVVLGLCAVVVGFVAGIYPSFFLSAFKPVHVLKGNVSLGMKSGFIRSALVVFQFTISIFLVIGTIGVLRQLQYIQNKKLGFNKEQIIMVDDAYALGKNQIAFKDEVLKNAGMVSATISGYLPIDGTWRNNNPWWVEGKSASEENMIALQNWGVDHDYIKTLGMSIKEGRDFSTAFPSDSSGVILNEAAAIAFGFNESAIGKVINTFESDNQGNLDKLHLKKLTVIGVVENFHFQSLKENVSPVMMFLGNNKGGMISFRFESQNTADVIRQIESHWNTLAPGQPFNYSFLDDRFGKMYAFENRLASVFGMFTLLAILIACLGLLALTAFTAEQRTKEIGIRKVLGASVPSILLMLSKDFGKLVIVAFCLAAPMAWYFISWWLNDYSYKTEIGAGVYLLSGVVAFVIAWLTMSFQSYKAASTDPVKSLRSE